MEHTYTSLFIDFIVQFSLMQMVHWEIPIYATPERYFIKNTCLWASDRNIAQAVLGYNYNEKIKSWAALHKDVWKDILLNAGFKLD